MIFLFRECIVCFVNRHPMKDINTKDDDGCVINTKLKKTIPEFSLLESLKYKYICRKCLKDLSVDYRSQYIENFTILHEIMQQRLAKATEKSCIYSIITLGDILRHKNSKILHANTENINSNRDDNKNDSLSEIMHPRKEQPVFDVTSVHYIANTSTEITKGVSELEIIKKEIENVVLKSKLVPEIGNISGNTNTQLQTTVNYYIIVHDNVDIINNSKNMNTNVESKTETDVDELIKNVDIQDGKTHVETEIDKTGEIVAKDPEFEPENSSKDDYKGTGSKPDRKHSKYLRYLDTAGINPFYCKICKKTFTRRNSLRAHQKYIHEEDPLKRPYHCTICFYKCAGKGYLKNHMRLHTKDSINSNRVSKKYGDRKNTKSQKKSTEKDVSVSTSKLGKYQFMCPICYEFLTDSGLEYHRKLHSKNNSFYCKICDETYNSQKSFAIHLRHKCNRPFECDVCGRKFPDKTNLKKHMRSHSGERPYHCTICSYKSFTSTYLKTHIKNMHSKDKPITYFCTICPFKCISSTYLKKHIAKIHSNKACEKYSNRKNTETDLQTPIVKDIDLDIDIVKNEIDDLGVKSEIISEILNDKSINVELKSETTIKNENLNEFALSGPLKIQSTNSVEKTDKLVETIQNISENFELERSIKTEIEEDESSYKGFEEIYLEEPDYEV